MDTAKDAIEKKISLATVKRNPDATRSPKRVGRGNGSGCGGTAGRGNKGQKSRSGFSVGTGFEGGQMPLYRRMPKQRGTGLRVTKPRKYQVINLKSLNKFEDGDTINHQLLYQARLINSLKMPVKICATGSIDKKFKIMVNAVSKSASEQITQAGGSVELI